MNPFVTNVISLPAITDLAFAWSWPALAAALLHSLWQAGLMGLLLAGALWLLPARSAGLRATISGTTQLGVVVVFLLTYAILSLPQRPAPEPVATAAAQSADQTLNHSSRSQGQKDSAQSERQDAFSSVVEPRPADVSVANSDWQTAIGIVWLLGVALMLNRIAADLTLGRGLVRRGQPVVARLANQVEEMRRRLKLRVPVRALWTEGLRVPAVYGLFRPALLLPSAVLQLPPEQLEAILAHELAHLKRCDWLWHLAGRIVEAVLFFNPAVWWIGRMVRREYESAADAVAVSLTGRPVEFAQALAAWASRSAAPALAPAWPGDRGSLRDRIVRVLSPAERPAIRLSPFGLIVALFAAAAILTGLWGGAQTAVTVAAELLSPAERIERIETAREQVALPGANSSNERRRVAVSGKIRTSDGRLLKETGRDGYGTISIGSRYIRGPASMTGVGYMGTVGPEGSFSGTVGDGEISITADWEGYAPALVGPLRPAPGQDLKDIDVLLMPGFIGRVQLSEPDGDQIVAATVVARLDTPASSQPRTFGADKNGIIEIKHAAKHPYELTVTAPGYEREIFHDIQLKPDEVISLQLTPTESTAGVVTDIQGKPVADARVRLFARLLGPSHVQITGQVGQILTTTDAMGQFVLDTLSQGERTVVLLEADGYGSEVVEVTTGQSNVKVQLGPQRILRGEIIGDLTKLDRRHAGGSTPVPSVLYSIRVPLFDGPVEFGRASNFGNLTAVVPDYSTGDPQRWGKFELRDLLPGELMITAGPARRVIEPFDGLKEGVTINLDEPISGGPPRRKVSVRFVPPDADDPPPTGQLRLDLKPMSDDAERRHEQFHPPIEEGRIEVSAFAPGTVSLLNAGMIGYWFDEDVIGRVGNTRAFAVPEGRGPFEVEVPVVPAGAIRGVIRMADRRPPTDPQQIDLQCYFGPQPGRGPYWTTAATFHPNANGEFVVTPVPLGETCHIILEVGRTKIISDPITLTADWPLAEDVMLQVPELVSATVRVVDSNGRPVVDRKVEISRSYPGWFTNYRGGGRTDETGRVTIDGLAADAFDQYEVSVSGEDHRPLATARLGEPGDETILTLPTSPSK